MVLSELFSKLEGKCSLRLGIFAHGDYCDADSSYVIKFSKFSSDVGMLQRFVDSCGDTGGGDAPECYELVCYQAHRELSWRSECTTKVLVLIGDAPPHEPGYSGFKPPAPYGGIDWREEARGLAANKILVYGVKCGAGGGPFWDEVPKMTGGSSLPLSDAALMPKLFVGIILKTADKRMFSEYERDEKDPTLRDLYAKMHS